MPNIAGMVMDRISASVSAMVLAALAMVTATVATMEGLVAATVGTFTQRRSLMFIVPFMAGRGTTGMGTTVGFRSVSEMVMEALADTADTTAAVTTVAEAASMEAVVTMAVEAITGAVEAGSFGGRRDETQTQSGNLAAFF